MRLQITCNTINGQSMYLNQNRVNSRQTFLREGLSAESAGESVVLIVGADVSLHVAFLGETFAAHSTRKGLFFGVNRSDVCLEITLLGESLTARVASIVFFSGMYFHVSVNISLLSETFAAYLSQRVIYKKFFEFNY